MIRSFWGATSMDFSRLILSLRRCSRRLPSSYQPYRWPHDSGPTGDDPEFYPQTSKLQLPLRISYVQNSQNDDTLFITGNIPETLALLTFANEPTPNPEQIAQARRPRCLEDVCHVTSPARGKPN